MKTDALINPTDFLSRPYHERKIFFACKIVTINSSFFLPSFTTDDGELHYLQWFHHTVFDLDQIPERIKLPIGHPIKNELYIGHPYKENVYLPFADYEIVLMKERIDEFCWLCQNLGAKEILLLNEKAVEEFCSNRTSGSVGGSILGIGSSARYSSSNTRYDSNYFKIKINQKFTTPVEEPRLPNDLVWYEYEDSWKNLYRQIQLSKGEYHIFIDTGSVNVFNSAEMKQIEGEYKMLNASYSSSSSSQFISKKNCTFEILVKF